MEHGDVVDLAVRSLLPRWEVILLRFIHYDKAIARLMLSVSSYSDGVQGIRSLVSEHPMLDLLLKTMGQYIAHAL